MKKEGEKGRKGRGEDRKEEEVGAPLPRNAQPQGQANLYQSTRGPTLDVVT